MNLSNEQIMAIEHFKGPALILAVPGAGKTTVLINRTYNLIKKHRIDPKRILSITFSRASAEDMKSRFLSNFPDQTIRNVHFSTIHSFCFSVVNEYGRKNKIKYKMIEANKNDLNKYIILKNLYSSINNKLITEEKLENLLANIGYIKNIMISPEEFLRENISDVENLVDIYYAYESFKKENNLLDFDDILSLSLEILQSNRELLDYYRELYDFIQVDEGQDTSKIQLELIKLLSFPNNNLFIVADDDQSIYGFRGAYPKALLRFKDIYPKAKIFYMEENFRSSKNIVSVSNKFIRQNKMRYNKNIFTNNDFLKPIEIIKTKNIREQYNFILDEIQNKSCQDMAILYRKNISSIGLIDLFERNNIDFYIKENNNRFFNHWIIGDIINFILFSRDITDLGLYEKIYYKKKGYISKKHLYYSKKLNPNLSVFKRILDYPSLNYYYKNTLYDLEEHFKELSKLTPDLAIDYIYYNLEYGNYLKEHSDKFGYSLESLNNIIDCLKLISREMNSLEDLIDRLNYLQSLCINSRLSEDSITLSTVHSSKGLEFSKVIIVDLIDGNFPSSSSIEAIEKSKFDLIEEERRLFYVAMTRAKHFLSLITIEFSKNRKLEQSRFLKEIKEVEL